MPAGLNGQAGVSGTTGLVGRVRQGSVGEHRHNLRGPGLAWSHSQPTASTLTSTSWSPSAGSCSGSRRSTCGRVESLRASALYDAAGRGEACVRAGREAGRTGCEQHNRGGSQRLKQVQHPPSPARRGPKTSGCALSVWHSPEPPAAGRRGGGGWGACRRGCVGGSQLWRRRRRC